MSRAAASDDPSIAMERENDHGSALCGSGGTPLNQGENGTCTGYAFGRVVATNLMMKYGVAIGAEYIAKQAIMGAQTINGDDVWHSNLLLEFAQTWNNSPVSKMFVPDVSNSKRYKLRVELVEIMTFDEAYEKMRELEMAGLEMMIAYKTGKRGEHAHHAITAFRCDPIAKEIVGMNSWGAHEPIKSVKAQNFIRAVMVDPVITEAAPASQKTGKVYTDEKPFPTTKFYKNMPKMFARVKKLEADEGGLRAAQEAQRMAEAAEAARQGAEAALQAVEAARQARAQADAEAVQVARGRADAAESEVTRQAEEIEALKQQVLNPPRNLIPDTLCALQSAP